MDKPFIQPDKPLNQQTLSAFVAHMNAWSHCETNGFPSEEYKRKLEKKIKCRVRDLATQDPIWMAKLVLGDM